MSQVLGRIITKIENDLHCKMINEKRENVCTILIKIEDNIRYMINEIRQDVYKI